MKKERLIFKICIVDDHILFSKSLGLMIEQFGNYKVVLYAKNGQDLQEKMNNNSRQIDLIFLDMNMPMMNGINTALWLKEKFPQIKTIALSINTEDRSVIQMLNAGCCTYLPKDVDIDILEHALHEVKTHGYYNSSIANIPLHKIMRHEIENFTSCELEFFKLASSEMTYKEIASYLNKSEKTIDHFRDKMFQKLNVKSRIGLVMEVLRQKII